jgi:hypothetical protein
VEKRGRPQADVNIAAVAAGQMADVNGGKQAAFFAGLGIKPLQSQKCHSRISESVSVAMVEVGKQAKEAVCKELRAKLIAGRAVLDAKGLVEFMGSGDGGWHTRGLGRNYASRTGEFSLFSCDTRKCFFTAAFNRTCSACSDALRRGKSAAKHVYWKNWDKSAKAMEGEGAAVGI